MLRSHSLSIRFMSSTTKSFLNPSKSKKSLILNSKSLIESNLFIESKPLMELKSLKESNDKSSIQMKSLRKSKSLMEFNPLLTTSSLNENSKSLIIESKLESKPLKNSKALIGFESLLESGSLLKPGRSMKSKPNKSEALIESDFNLDSNPLKKNKSWNESPKSLIKSSKLIVESALLNDKSNPVIESESAVELKLSKTSKSLIEFESLNDKPNSLIESESAVESKPLKKSKSLIESESAVESKPLKKSMSLIESESLKGKLKSLIESESLNGTSSSFESESALESKPSKKVKSLIESKSLNEFDSAGESKHLKTSKSLKLIKSASVMESKPLKVSKSLIGSLSPLIESNEKSSIQLKSLHKSKSLKEFDVKSLNESESEAVIKSKPFKVKLSLKESKPLKESNAKSSVEANAEFYASNAKPLKKSKTLSRSNALDKEKKLKKARKTTAKKAWIGEPNTAATSELLNEPTIATMDFPMEVDLSRVNIMGGSKRSNALKSISTSKPRPWSVVFDLDGTLADTLPDIALAANFAMRTVGGREQSNETIRSFVGDGAKILIDRMINNAGFNATQAKELNPKAMSSFLEKYSKNPSSTSTKLFPGVGKGLKRLKSNHVHVSICTNKPQSIARELVKCDATLATYFPESTVIGEEVGLPKKPDPRHLVRAVNAAWALAEPSHRGVWSKNIIVIGDGQNDVLAAAALGVKAIFVTYGYGYSTNHDAAKLDHPELVIVNDFKSAVDQVLKWTDV